MPDCKNLTHPFLKHPGVNQRNRVIDELLSDKIKIDGRTLADLLNYFTQLSGSINYYDKSLHVSDWQPFFKDSIPFLLAAINKYDAAVINDKFRFYTSLFEKQPSDSGLQLNIYYFFYNTINKINQWHLKLKDAGLPIGLLIADLITNKLRQPLKDFICLTNAAVKWYCVKRIDFTKFTENEIWDLDMADVFCMDQSFRDGVSGKCSRMRSLQKKFTDIFSPFLEGIKILAEVAAQNIDESLLPLREEFREQHKPHLGLLFAFLKLFQQLQADLNKKTKDHLNFFYKDVLRLKLRDAEPDHANIVFELQDQVNKHLLSKSIKVKGDKDDKQQEILFSLDDEIIVNRTQVAEVRTLYLNNEEVYDTTYLEGVYIAPKATTADGVEKDFKDGDPTNWYTLGNHYSKYTEPGKTSPKPYPSARLGFILASPVLLLNEGTRTVNITLSCALKESFCRELALDCVPRPGIDCPVYPDFYSAQQMYAHMVDALYDKVSNIPHTYIYLSGGVIESAVNNGMSETSANVIRDAFLLEDTVNRCTGEKKQYKDFSVVKKNDWDLEIGAEINIEVKTEVEKLPDIFKERSPFKILFSGKDEWLTPSSIDTINLVPDTGAPEQFILSISILLNTDKGPVTFYDKEKLKEDFNTTQPLVKIELDDIIKVNLPVGDETALCCLEREPATKTPQVSLYHFFRNVTIQPGTAINVKVCGLKNFIVQNEETVQDVNSPIYPFGTRPKIIDFDVVSPRIPVLPDKRNLAGPNFYLGSEEIFLKKWENLCVSINWKDKPSDFNEYYKAYVKRTGYHDCAVPPVTKDIFGLNECEFLVRLALLQDGTWEEETEIVSVEGEMREQIVDRPLFSKDVCEICTTDAYEFSFSVKRALFTESGSFIKSGGEFKSLEADTRYGFLRFNLRNQDFLHKDYAAVLARQMLAVAKFPKKDDVGITGTVYLEGEGELSNGSVPIPNQPWDPIISNMELGYDAVAILEDIDLIHLYPYEGTYKPEEIELEPSLFPVFCDEGTLFIGLKDLVPGVNLNILFQLAEATADSESEKEELHWQYLYNNVWKDLRKGFEILIDDNGKEATEGLTTSGIIKFVTPENMTKNNTILPKDLYWIKASVPKNSKCVAEIIKIFTQAVPATFTNEAANDKLRLASPLAAESISKLDIADASIKTVLQPYDSFGGKVPEIEGPYYLRVSELLRHKGRAIQKWDYERLALEEFPQLFKAKCITHSFKTDANEFFNDVPVAPGYVLLAVIPDLNKLKAGNSFEPKVPVSMLEKIQKYLQKLTSPFVRLWVENPRYEKVHFCLTVRLVKGKDEVYYKEKIREDISMFLAPWAVGEYYKLTFGQCVNRSDIIRFLETKDYVDFILEIKMQHENDTDGPEDIPVICPHTPRSILVAGDIDAEIDPEICDEWCLDEERKCKNGKIPIVEYCKEITVE